MITIGSPEQFAAVRDCLRNAEYTEEAICRELGIARLGDLEMADKRVEVHTPLARLFFAGNYVPVAELDGIVPSPGLDAMKALGLISRTNGHWYSSVILYPAADLYLISDRFLNPDGSVPEIQPEFVYFALTPNTHRFITMLPQRSCRNVLDLGAGSGIAALAQAKWAEQSWASDIAPRSVLFAEFNKRLNAVENVTVVESDMYNALSGEVFDRIICHPPYEVSLDTQWVFADGGDDGEKILRGVVSGLGERLEPGGQFFALARASDREGSTYEQRLRQWLGDKQGEFDIAMLVRDLTNPSDYAAALSLSTRKLEHLGDHLRQFEELKVLQLVYAHILIERRTVAGTPLTIRRAMGQRVHAEDLEWLLRNERSIATANVMDAVLIPSPAMELQVRHVMKDGELEPVEYKFKCNHPFTDELPCPSWVAYLVSKCDGRRTGSQVFAVLRERHSLNENEFKGAVRRLIGSAVLQLASGKSTISSS
jgi:methylase of polypeptide subunit release factors